MNTGELDASGLEDHVYEVLSKGSRMFRRIVVCLAFVLFAIGPLRAGERHPHHINPVPFAHEPCSVLSHEPCTPTFCSVFGHWPCIPEIFYPYGQNLQLTILTVPPQDQAAKYQKPDHDLDNIGDLFQALRSCWTPPPADDSRQDMQMSVRFSFKRSGEMIGAPRMTYVTAGVPADTRATYLNAINASLNACLPLKFTGGLGGAIAGRPIAIRYVDNRQLEKQAGKS